LELISDEQLDRFFTTFQRTALHLEMRDVYAVTEEAQRFRWFLEKGYRDHDAEAEQRRPWTILIQNCIAEGKALRRARIISEPVTDYIRYEWAGTSVNVEAGEEVKWLPRRLASGIALPGNDFWLFDDSTVAFAVFSGQGQVFQRQLTTDPLIVQLCLSAFETVWALGIPHAAYTPPC
jgi:hypothetical protein